MNPGHGTSNPVLSLQSEIGVKESGLCLLSFRPNPSCANDIVTQHEEVGDLEKLSSDMFLESGCHGAKAALFHKLNSICG